MTTKQLKKLVGKMVQWQNGAGMVYSGRMQQVQGGNFQVNGVWHSYLGGRGNVLDLKAVGAVPA